jgi:hypothetical protein
MFAADDRQQLGTHPSMDDNQHLAMPPPSRRLGFQAMEKKYFVVQSYGRTATQWLTDVLNSDPDVFCTHANDISYLFETPVRQTFIHSHSIAPLLRLIGNEKHLLTMGLFTDCPFVGNVHGMDAVHLSLHSTRLGRDIAYAIITRHPVERIESYVARWIYECEQPGAEFIRDNYLSGSARILSGNPELLVGMDLSNLRHRLFVSAVHHAHANDAYELGSHLPVFRMEDITSSTGSLKELCRHLFMGDEQMVERVAQAAGGVRSRDSRSAVTGAEAVLESWTEWECQVFNGLFANEQTRQRYADRGYRVAFERWWSSPSGR